MSDVGVYQNWDVDSDGELADNAFYEGLCGYYDETGDGVLDDEEYANWEEDHDEGLWDN